MKTLLTLFVLFFSSSLLAGDDLIGKKLICSFDGNKGFVRTFSFIDENFAHSFFSHFSQSDGTVYILDDQKYVTYPTIIEIYGSGSGIYTINRETLGITLTHSNHDIDFGICKLFNNSMDELLKTLKKMHKEKLKILKKNNKI
tara:strand:- start:118 stop:546 length:429 start_codon:yes stop_codon:yes gene_type:complete